MFRFESCENVPVRGGRGGLVEVEGRVVWGRGGGGVYSLDDKDKWKRLTDGVELGATPGVCDRRLVMVGGLKGGVYSKKVMLWRGGRWSLMSDMLVRCRSSCVVSIGGGGLVVMGGEGDGSSFLAAVQVFDGKTQTWHFGPSLPEPCYNMSAVVHGDLVFVMGGVGMARAVRCANINDLIAVQSQEITQQSTWRKLPDVPYYYSAVCVVDGVLLAIGGEDLSRSKKTSAIYALHPVDQKWQHVGNMPFECSYVDTLLLSGGRLLVVDGGGLGVLRVTVEGLAMVFPSPLNTVKTDDRRLYEEAMTKGYVEYSVTKCLILGAAGIGKTHLKHLLLKKDHPKQRVSTGLADNPVRAISFTLAGVGGQEEDDWFVVEDDQALMSVIGGTIKGGVSMAPSLADVVSTLPKIAVDPSNVPSDGAVGPSPAGVNITKDTTQPEQSRTADIEDELVHHITSDNRKLFGVKWIQFIDSGGQLQYHDILPLFIQDPMVIIFVLKLSEELSHHPTIEYYGSDGKPVGKPYRSSLSHKQILQHCLAAIRSQDAHPLIIIVGTHRDTKDSCAETIEKKNQQLQAILNSTHSKAVYCGGVKELIFAVNGLSPKDVDRHVAQVLRKEIVSEFPQQLIKQPIAWHRLEIVLQRSSHDGLLSLEECQVCAKKLHIEGEVFSAALHHLVKYNVFLYYPKVLPQTVFCDPQVVLTKVTELVQYHHKLRDNPEEGVAVRGDLVRFRDHGLLSMELLRKFPKHYKEGLFTPQDLVKLLVSCGAIAMIRDGEYLMPALLPHLDSTQVSKYLESSASLMIRFTHGYIPSGLFCCLVALLLSKSWDVCMDGNQPLRLYHNCITLIQRDTPEIVTLVDMLSYIAVHVDEASSDVCREIRDCVHNGIKSACDALKYQDVQFKDAFMCAGARCASDPPHVAVVVSRGAVYKWRCTIRGNQVGDLIMDQLMWLPDCSLDESVIPKQKDSNVHTMDTILVDQNGDLNQKPSTKETSLLQVPSPQLAITTQPEPLNVQRGSEAVLSCRAKGLPGQMITYQWYKGVKALPSDTSGDLRIPRVTCEDEGKYNCVVSCGEKKIDSDYVDIHVQLEEADCIEITRHPAEDVKVRANDAITLSCEARNKAGKELVYEWFKGNKKDRDGQLYNVNTNVQCTSMMKFYCKVSLKDKDGVFKKSRLAKVTVVSLWFPVQPQNVDGCTGERVFLWCHAENIASPEEKITHVWKMSANKEGPFKPCGSGEIYIIESLSDQHAGYYKCQANLITSDIVCLQVKAHSSTVEAKVPVICITKQPCGWAIEPDKSFSLICKATASKGDVTYQWYKDGSVLPEEQKSEFKRMSAKLSDFGSYYCLVRTVEGGAVALSDTVRVEIRERSKTPWSTMVHKTAEGHYAQGKVALLIGNGQYKNMEQLDCVESEIKELQRSLTNLNFRVFSLLDLKYDEMLAALEQFYSLLQLGVYAVFYFSGHGFMYNEVTYLMPIDAASNPVMCDSNISAKTIKDGIENMYATGLILLDCCAVSEEHLKIQGPKNNTTSLASEVENHCQISACLEGSSADMHVFNKALVECLKMKITFHELGPAIKEEMKKKMVKQSPTMTGITQEKVSLHDPIRFESEDAMKHSDLLLERHTRANNSPPNTTARNLAAVPTNWVKGKLLGSGGFGQVFLCHDQDTGRQLAVKMVDIDDTKSLHLQQEVQLFETEKKLRHERIVTYYGTDIKDGKMCIFMEFMPGGSVSKRLHTGALTETITCKYTKQILEGVVYLHDNKIMHRDIRGANILIDSNDNIKLADFGTAKRIQTNCSGLKSEKGTSYWMAPEVIRAQYDSKSYTVKADIWSLGATVVEMLTGHPPWHEYEPMAAMFAIGNLNEDARPNLPSDCSEQAEHFVRLCFKKDPSQRPSAQELLDNPFVINS